MTTTLDIRCPEDRRELFMKMVMDDVPQVVNGNLMEFACRACAKQGRKYDPDIARVFHYFNIAGEFVETRIDTYH